MKYFTPELYERIQNVKDESGLRQWDQAVNAYEQSLRQHVGQLPRSLTPLVKTFDLHDAIVVSMHLSGVTLSIALQLDPPLAYHLVLAYTLVEDPVVNHNALPDPYRTQEVAWLYDELGIGEPVMNPGQARRPKSRSGDEMKTIPVFTHDILLSNGWEIDLKFRTFKLRRLQALLPQPPIVDGRVERKMPQSA
jgi:hypothetical protein